MTIDIEQKLEVVATELCRAKRVLFITGAGISADSGLPTYRGVGGLDNTEQTEEGFPIEQCLSASMFRVRPEITWKYMLRIGEAVVKCQPNPAHKIIAQWEKDFALRGGNVLVFTQNIDGYHRLAGSENVLEIHGTLSELICTKCAWETSLDLQASHHPLLQDAVPKCPKCHAVIRPRIILFEEMLPRQVLAQFAEEFAGGSGFDMVFSIGTSAMFPYITEPVYEAIRHGITTVEINPAMGELSHRVAYHMPMGAADALTRLDVLVAAIFKSSS
jgi:NAD-dependent deacetylase